MKLTKTKLLIWVILGLIIITALSLLVKAYIIPVIFGAMALLGYKAQRDPVSQKIREREKKANNKIDQIRQEVEQTKAQDQELTDRANKFMSRSEGRRRGLLIIILFLFAGVITTRAADNLPRDYETLKKWYIEDTQEAAEIIKAYQAREKEKDQQIKDLLKAVDEIQAASQAKDQIIADLNAKLIKDKFRWGITGGLDLDRGWDIGISQKRGFWGWNVQASPGGDLRGSVTWWLPNF